MLRFTLLCQSLSLLLLTAAATAGEPASYAPRPAGCPSPPVCPDDYHRKPLPCLAPFCQSCCDDYCRKPLPLLPCPPPACCPDTYCPKPPPCPPGPWWSRWLACPPACK